MTDFFFEKNFFHEKTIKTNQRFFYFVFLRWLRFVFSLKIVNRGNYIGLDRPLLIVANHSSAWDPFLVFSALGRNFFLNEKLWRIPAFHGHFNTFFRRTFFKALGVYPIRREGELSKSLWATIELLKSGYNILFFPEGKRVFDRQGTQPPKRGIGFLLREFPVYVLPVYINYTGSRGIKDFCLVKAEIVFGEIIVSEELVEKNPDTTRHEAIMDLIWSLKLVKDNDNKVQSSKVKEEISK